MTADLQAQEYENATVLYMALELSNTKWRLAFGDGTRQRQVVIAAGDIAALCEELTKVKAKWGLSPEVAVVSCYEAGRDGFWVHRQLGKLGIANQVVDAASIEVSRRARRAKTDRLDAEALLEKLIRYARGERRVWRVVRVPEPVWEDLRQLHREREDLLTERTRHRNRLSSKLVAQGVRLPIGKDFVARLEAVKLFDGSGLPAHLKASLIREWERLQGVQAQLRAVEQAISELIESADRTQGVRSLMLLTGVGWVSAWVLVMELFGWRELTNRRQLASLAGLVPTPYSSGNLARDQGISKAGNRRVRALMIQLAWLWLRYQPDSKHSCWFQERFGGGSKRQRRIGIVALARRLLIDLWRFVESGVVPAGARLKVGVA
ncbi:IS110 family transposase [Candidatus Thiosymbion oneisti]|uniref:IS110 family transposase n=1 Tax=Candidatus Thiosymbion oneisti TaxID=589554 RepID=UPI000A50F142|nr:IS110 family transposase [Candidatus Thiosymbion oneisti]